MCRRTGPVPRNASLLGERSYRGNQANVTSSGGAPTDRTGPRKRGDLDADTRPGRGGDTPTGQGRPERQQTPEDRGRPRPDRLAPRICRETKPAGPSVRTQPPGPRRWTVPGPRRHLVTLSEASAAPLCRCCPLLACGRRAWELAPLTPLPRSRGTRSASRGSLQAPGQVAGPGQRVRLPEAVTDLALFACETGTVPTPASAVRAA